MQISFLSNDNRTCLLHDSTSSTSSMKLLKKKREIWTILCTRYLDDITYILVISSNLTQQFWSIQSPPECALWKVILNSFFYHHRAISSYCFMKVWLEKLKGFFCGCSLVAKHKRPTFFVAIFPALQTERPPKLAVYKVGRRRKEAMSSWYNGLSFPIAKSLDRFLSRHGRPKRSCSVWRWPTYCTHWQKVGPFSHCLSSALDSLFAS